MTPPILSTSTDFEVEQESTIFDINRFIILTAQRSGSTAKVTRPPLPVDFATKSVIVHGRESLGT